MRSSLGVLGRHGAKPTRDLRIKGSAATQIVRRSPARCAEPSAAQSRRPRRPHDADEVTRGLLGPEGGVRSHVSLKTISEKPTKTSRSITASAKTRGTRPPRAGRRRRRITRATARGRRSSSAGLPVLCRPGKHEPVLRVDLSASVTASECRVRVSSMLSEHSPRSSWDSPTQATGSP